MKIGIIGCGWLGLPLATSLIKDGHTIHGSTTSQDKIKDLKTVGISPFLISVNEQGIEGNVKEFLKDLDILIVNIPPRLRRNPEENYVFKIKNLLAELKNTDIKKLLFIGSTSIYANDNSVVTEKTIPKPETESGRQLVEVEKLITSSKNFKPTILRFGGLFNENRNPANFLSGRKNVANPFAPVNLIHLTDCIDIIKAIIKNNVWNEDFNAASPEHPLKKEYYTTKALELGLEPPQFNMNLQSKGKTINSSKLVKMLDYNFIVSL